jgi:hypothetical protein
VSAAAFTVAPLVLVLPPRARIVTSECARDARRVSSFAAPTISLSNPFFQKKNEYKTQRSFRCIAYQNELTVV